MNRRNLCSFFAITFGTLALAACSTTTEATSEAAALQTPDVEESSVAPSSDQLLSLPEHAALELNRDFIVKSAFSRSGTGEQAIISTISIDLKGTTPEAEQSRNENAAAIEKLKELKFFASIERVHCFVDFNAKIYDDVTISKGAQFKLSTPLDYGTPSEKYTKTGKRIRIENYSSDKAAYGNFEDPIMRRMYCGFHAPSEWYNEHFLDDLKISHLEVLLAPAFTLKY